MFASTPSSGRAGFRLPLAITLAAIACSLPFAALAQSAGTVTTIGGGGLPGYVEGGNDASLFNSPRGIALGGPDHLYIADYGNNAIRVMRLADLAVSTFAAVNRPLGLAFDAYTNLYVISEGSSAVLKFDAFGNARPTLFNGVSNPAAIAVGPEGDIYVAESGGTIRRIAPNGIQVGTYIVGRGSPQLRGIAVFENGRVVVSDAAAHVLWSFDGPGSFPVVFAGTLNSPGDTNGEKDFGKMNSPHRIARGPNNSIVVADRLNHRVRVVSCSGILMNLWGINPSEWETFPASEVFPGWVDGSVFAAEAREPIGVAVSSQGAVYDSEAFYHLVRSGSGFTFPSRCDSTGGGNGEIIVPVPQISPSGGFFPGGVTVSITASNSPAGFGSDVDLYYTMDGTDPDPVTGEPIGINNGVGQIFFPGPVDLSNLRVRAFIGDASSPIILSEPTVAPVPVLSPDSGFYPMGVRVTVTSTNGFPEGTRLHYTRDGTIPTTNSPVVIIENGAGVIPWRESTLDLRSLSVKAFLGPTESPVVTGRAVHFASQDIRGEIGIPRGFDGEALYAGIGSQAYILPLVANLSDEVELRSVQFVVELVAQPGAPRLESRNDLQILPISSNDFVQVRAASTNLPNNSFSTILGPTNRLAIAYIGTNSAFHAEGFATIAMLRLQFRPGPDSQGNIAEEGDQYTIRIRQVSGTSDGVQDLINLAPMPERTLTLRNTPFLLGDTSPGFWYNAGDFGNAFLENGDVNNVIFAGFGFRQPYAFSDAFFAMDATRDGLIDFTDAETILRRALGFDPVNFIRQRDASGNWMVFPANSGLAAFSASYRASSAPLSADAEIAWERDVTLRAGIQDALLPGGRVRIPVVMKAGAGRLVSGLQFVADVLAEDGAPAVSSVAFLPSPVLQAPSMHGSSVPGLGTLPNTVYARWNNLEAAFEGALQLGEIEFFVPSGARVGDHYTVQLHHAGGAALDDSGALQSFSFQTVAGSAWVAAPAAQTERVSEEWALHFFGQSGGPAAPQEDADGDGLDNYSEFLAGTHPLERNWLARKDQAGRFIFRWVGKAGKKYVVETTEDFTGWTPATGELAGQDAFLEYSEEPSSGRLRFYRLKIQD